MYLLVFPLNLGQLNVLRELLSRLLSNADRLKHSNLDLETDK